MASRKPSRSEWRLKGGKWTRTLGHRGCRVRLFQNRRDGVFYRAVWVPREERFDRRSLGTSDRGEADRLGALLLAGLLGGDQQSAAGVLTLSELWERYRKDSPKFQRRTERNRIEMENRVAILTGYFGEDCDVAELTENDVQAFTAKRLAGGIMYQSKRRGGRTERAETRPARLRSVSVDLGFLITMLRWATTVRVRKGRRLLSVNPLAGMKRQHEQDPRRPVATWERYQATRAALQKLAADACAEAERHRAIEQHDAAKRCDASRRRWTLAELALVLAEATGRRIGSIRQLRWEDIDLIAGTIRWAAAADKKRREWRVPIPAELREELRVLRTQLGGPEGRLVLPSAWTGLVFASFADPSVAIRTDVLARWLRAAEVHAELPKLDGSLWHAYRRSWATARKDLPAVDVAYAGGWRDVGTLLKHYQQPDESTLLDVMAHSKRITEAPIAGANVQ